MPSLLKLGTCRAFEPIFPLGPKLEEVDGASTVKVFRDGTETDPAVSTAMYDESPVKDGDMA